MLTLETGPDLSNDLFSQIDFSGGVIAAVSGGSDSTALLLLLKSHLERFAPKARLLAVTVDHDLRLGSAAEAQAVARLCDTLGVAHRILVWSGPKPSSGLPAAAREARYRLLAGLAADEGIGLVLTGHTADDQAETVLMRHARDERDDDEGERSEGRGLAGMAPATLYDWRVWIVRPLLGARRAALRAFLRGRDVGWAEDPTNADASFERPRIRATLSGEDGAVRREQAIAVAAEAANQRERLGGEAARLIGVLASRPGAGLIRLDPGIMAAEEAVAVYALRILLATMGGTAFLPDRDRVAALFGRLKAGPLRATLSRSVVDARRSGIFLHREARDLPPAAKAVTDTVWDGRRRITLSDRDASLLIAPIGPAAAGRYTAIGGETPQSLVRAALAVEPTLFRLDADAPHPRPEGGVSPDLVARPVVAPFARFLPSFDLAPARIVAELVGARPMPRMAFVGDDAGDLWAKA